MSVTLDIIEQMVSELSNHNWQTVTPSVVFRGPIPPGNLDWPCIAVFATTGRSSDGGSGVGYNGSYEEFNWTLATHLGLDGVENTYLRHVEWRDESQRIFRRAIDEYWGLGGIVTMVNLDPQWESAFFELGTEAEATGHIVATTMKQGVQHREAF